MLPLRCQSMQPSDNLSSLRPDTDSINTPCPLIPPSLPASGLGGGKLGTGNPGWQHAMQRLSIAFTRCTESSGEDDEAEEESEGDGEEGADEDDEMDTGEGGGKGQPADAGGSGSGGSTNQQQQQQQQQAQSDVMVH